MGRRTKPWIRRNQISQEWEKSILDGENSDCRCLFLILLKEELQQIILTFVSPDFFECFHLVFVFVGLFLRHMILAYSKLSFSQVFKLYTALQQYFQNGEKKTVEDADMELTSTEEGERKMEKEELDVSIR